MFDITKEVQLGKKYSETYRKFQAGFYVLAAIFAIYLATLILFPTRYFSFSFPNPDSTKNTIISPRDKDGNFAERGRMNADGAMLFDAAIPGNYSRVKVNITLDKKSEFPQEANLSLRKSYQAFFYPQGENIGDPYSVDEFYHNLRLVSYGNSVYQLSGTNYYPIDSVETFNNAGLNWNDVSPISSDQLANYQKGKLFTVFSPHVDGTIMADENNKMYIIKDGQKHEIPTQHSLSWHPVLVSSASLNTIENCRLIKNALSFRTFSCSIPLDKFRSLEGKDYEFNLTSDTDLKIESIETNFETSANWENFRAALADILKNIKRNYYGEPTQ